jgi:hypothetical protein
LILIFKYIVRLLHPPRKDKQKNTLSKQKLQRAYVLSTEHKFFYMRLSHTDEDFREVEKALASAQAPIPPWAF